MLRLILLTCLIYVFSSCIGIDKSIIDYKRTSDELLTLAEQHKEYKSSKNWQETISVTFIQERLQSTETFLEYFCYQGGYYCLVITSKKTTLKNCGKQADIDSLIQIQQNHIYNKAFNKNIARQLSDKLLPESLSKSIIIRPCDKLRMISFDALQGSSGNNYLILNHDIEYAFSAASYFKSKPATDYSNTYGFFPDVQNSLLSRLHTALEEQVLSDMPHYKEFKLAKASKENFIQECTDASILHIATHTRRAESDTLQNNILFSPYECLTYQEIEQLKLQTQLITLAMCNSNNITEDEVMDRSLTSAFHIAGAHHILSSLGDAPDRAGSKIISSFYKNIKDGYKEAEALRLAKIKYLKLADAIGAEPYFWANYTLYGDRTAVEIKTGRLTIFLYMFIAGVVLCVSIVKIYKKVSI